MYRMAAGPDGDHPAGADVQSNKFEQNKSTSNSMKIQTTDSNSLTNSELIAREIHDGTLSGYIGPGTVITGEISFKGTIRIEGQVGQLSSEGGTVVVGGNGKVEGDMNVASALISGNVSGNIVASERVELGRTAKVQGNIQSALLSIEEGAVFEGSCRMSPVRKTDATMRETTGPRGGAYRANEDFNSLAAGLNAAVGGTAVIRRTPTNNESPN